MQFKLPELGEGVHEGELVKWSVKVGDRVKYDQSLCEIMTDKATVEIPSAFEGRVAELHVKEGQVVHVGELMLSFAEASAASPSPQVSSSSTHAAPASGSPATSVPSAGAKNSPPVSTVSSVVPVALENLATRPLAAPSTRRMARESGIDLASVHGTGPHGRIMKDDVQKAQAGPVSGQIFSQAPAGPSEKNRGLSSVASTRLNRMPTEGGEQRVAFRGLRKKIAEKMRLSKDKAAHFTYVEEADATALVALRNQSKEIAAQKGIKLTYLPFVMKAMVAALKQYPILNSTLDEERAEIVYHQNFNIGLSVQTEDGLTAPVVKNVGNKSILEIAAEIQALVERARAKRLTLDDLQGSTITLTNAGSIGGLFATPVINFPEVAIVGLNKIARKAVVKVIEGREEIVIRDWTYFSISLDHRIVDGAVGAEFMKRMIHFIENPTLMLLESL